MASYNKGKKFVVQYLVDNFKIGTRVLDVGSCDGKWYKLLSRYFKMDSIEAFTPNIIKYKLLLKYDNVFNVDVCDFKCDKNKYSVIVMGDILEHLTVEQGQNLIKELYDKSQELLVAVPYQLPQEVIYNNPYEEHKQADLTHEIFMKRYPGFKVLWQDKNYGYYIKDNK